MRVSYQSGFMAEGVHAASGWFSHPCGFVSGAVFQMRHWTHCGELLRASEWLMFPCMIDKILGAQPY